MDDTKTLIKEAKGSYKVYVAVKGDPNLDGKFRCTKKGTLYFNGKQMNDPDFSEVAVYLAKQWQVAVSHEDLKMGLMACSTKIDPAFVYGVMPTPEYKRRVIDWLNDNPPGPDVYTITTDTIAQDIDQNGFKNQRRLTEMKIASILREQGLQKARVTFEGERKVRWFPIDQD